MRILHITSQFPGMTGSGTYLQAMISEANKKRFSQGLVGAVQDDMHYMNNNLEYVDMLEFNKKTIPFPIMGMSDKMPYKSSVYSEMKAEDIKIWEEEFSKKVKNAIANFSPDIILSNHLWLATAMATQISGNIPIYGISHGTDIRQMHKVPWLAKTVAKGLANISGVFALTVDQKATIERLYGISGHKIKVVGGGFDEDIFHPADRVQSADGIRMVYAGKLSYSKGLLPLMEAYKDIRSIHKTELVFAGSGIGGESEEIQRLGKELGVRFTGALNQKELADLFRESHIFILPSYYEGLPLVIMEALACGLRVVSTDIPGLRNHIGEEITSSGLVQFIDLPRMVDVDTPLEEDYGPFVEKLKKTLKIQIRNANDGYNILAPFKEEIRALSWEGVFERISDSF